MHIKRSIFISHLNCCTLSIDTLCCHVQISSPNRFKFSFRKTFSNINIHTYFFLLDTLSILKVLLHDSVESSRVLHPRKKANGPFSFESCCQHLTTFILPLSKPFLEHSSKVFSKLSISYLQIRSIFCFLTYCFASLLVSRTRRRGI